jgi:hypothetical protein
MIGRGSTIVASIGLGSRATPALAPVGQMNARVLRCSAQVTLA